MRTAAKAKVTVSLDAELVAALDEFVKRGEAPSRSAAVEDILRQWRKEEMQKQLEREIEAYYLSLTEEEKEEDREWAEFAGRSLAHIWEDERQWENRSGAKSTSSKSPVKRKRARR